MVCGKLPPLYAQALFHQDRESRRLILPWKRFPKWYGVKFRYGVKNFNMKRNDKDMAGLVSQGCIFLYHSAFFFFLECEWMIGLLFFSKYFPSFLLFLKPFVCWNVFLDSFVGVNASYQCVIILPIINNFMSALQVDFLDKLGHCHVLCVVVRGVQINLVGTSLGHKFMNTRAPTWQSFQLYTAGGMVGHLFSIHFSCLQKGHAVSAYLGLISAVQTLQILVVCIFYLFIYFFGTLLNC